MLVQRRTIDIGAVLETSVPQSSEPSSFHPPSGFSQGEDVGKKRKRGEEKDGEDEDQQELPLTDPLKTKSSSKKGKSKSVRALQKAAGLIPHKRKHRNSEPQVQ